MSRPDPAALAQAGVQVYAGTAGHSAWFSADLGETWVHPNSHSGMYLEARVWSFACHPALPRYLYAGTDHGLYRFDETTLRWSAIDSPMSDIWSVAIDPRDPSRLLCGTRPAGFWCSPDAGASWQRLDAPGLRDFSEIVRGPTRVTQILFDPIDEDTVWAGVEIGGIFRSTDRGLTWAALDRGLASADVHGVAVSRDDSGRKRVLATTNYGLHLSHDNGETWALHPLDTPWQYMRAIVADPADPRTLWMTNGNGPPGSTGRLWRSRDGGLGWETVELPGPLNSTPWCVAAHPSEPALRFVCTNLGQLFRSLDAGESWERLPHEFGEVRALCWRPVPPSLGRGAEHSLTRRPPPPATVAP
jgi:photosystem II stability/assembly factor-like uncharacterized protein